MVVNGKGRKGADREKRAIVNFFVVVLRFSPKCGIINQVFEKEGEQVEWNDIYDSERRRTGRVHRRGTRWRPGEFGLVVCVWVYDGHGRLLLTRRAPGKSFAGTWENSGGAAQAGESSRRAIARELFEETGIRAKPEEFEFIGSDRDKNTFFDFYCLKRQTPTAVSGAHNRSDLHRIWQHLPAYLQQ